MISLFEVYLKLIGYDINRAYKELEKVRRLSSDELHQWQENRKWEIAKYHFNNTPYYKQKVGKFLPDNWEDLPIMKKSDYQNNIVKLLSKGYTKRNTYISNTSGSSGHPFYFAKNKEAHAMTWALIKNRYSWHGLNLNSKQARFFGTPLETSSYLKEKIKHFLINRTLFPIFDMSDKTLGLFTDKFKKTKFKYIYGYTNSLVIFAKYLNKNNIVLKQACSSLTLCIATSEVLTNDDRLVLTKGFGVDVINEYGVSETGAIVAFEDKHHNWLVNKETQFVEIVSSNKEIFDYTKAGEIIITDLYNYAMPFIRYSVGDIGNFRNGVEIDGHKILNSLQGRINDIVKLPSGKISPGLTFYYISRSILESSGIIKEFIIRQTAIDTFVFNIVSDRELNNHEIKDIEQKMDYYLEPGLTVKIQNVANIERPSSGKIKHFYSEIN
jgi:phenylacetate-CoA ligase